MATGDRGLTEFTVKEATNLLAQRKVIRVTPILDEGTSYTQHDVLFASTEIPNAVLAPGGCSKLVRLDVYNHKDSAVDMDIVLTENQANLGTMNSAVASGSLWTEPLVKAAGVLGFFQDTASDMDIDLINGQFEHISASTNHLVGNMPIMLQASGGSTSVYFSAVDRTGSVDFGADDLEFIFHVEYLG